ncbi:MAG: 4Fe-4S dicluster domain-containing protein, partial [Methylococcaceae bacterium]|nr:4Fe-4S dicluster domain-containing protein [Methylococcaceae bacterium]
MKCGLCVPHCPTYRKTLDENESPRGRISLIQAWSTGGLEDTPSLRRHLDNCLLCRTCENLCPAQVPYSRLLDNFRSVAGKRRQSY